MKMKNKLFSLLICSIISIGSNTPALAYTLPLPNDNVIVPYDRGSCRELVDAGFNYGNCPTDYRGRPNVPTVKVTHAQWNCLITVTGGMSGMFIAPYTVPYALWRMYSACHKL